MPFDDIYDALDNIKAILQDVRNDLSKLDARLANAQCLLGEEVPGPPPKTQEPKK